MNNLIGENRAQYKDRIVALLDLDCFYVQCEQRQSPETWGKPCAVVQYSNWTSGGLIAVNYEARPFGIKRGMRADEANKLCKDVHIFTVPDRNGKADLTRYRDASTEVFDIIVEYIRELEQEVGGGELIIMERASVDEAYLDLTAYINAKPLVLPSCEDLAPFSTHLAYGDLSIQEWLQKMTHGESFDKFHLSLLFGALMVGRLRQRVFEQTQFRCSAGISHNKMLAKLVAGVHKPNAQTILPFEGVPHLFQSVKISSVTGLGGKIGQKVREKLGIETMGQLGQVDLDTLMEHFTDRSFAEWLSDYAKGADYRQVVDRRLSLSIGSGKNFPGKSALKNLEDIERWVKILCEDVHDRLEADKSANKRIAQQIVVSYTTSDGQFSKTLKLSVVDGTYPPSDSIANNVLKIILPIQALSKPILNISLNAASFTDLKSLVKFSRIESFFRKVPQSAASRQLEIVPTNPNDDNDDGDSADGDLAENCSDGNIGGDGVEDDENAEEEAGEEEYDEEEEEESDDEVGEPTEYVTIQCDNEEFVIPRGLLPPARAKKIVKSYFFKKCLRLYDYENFDSDSDLASFFQDKDDSEEEESSDGELPAKLAKLEQSEKKEAGDQYHQNCKEPASEQGEEDGMET